MSAKGFGRGCFGDLVGLLQGALQQQGFYTGAVDGDFGGGTERAVRGFQALVREAMLRDPELVRSAFGGVADELVERLAGSDWEQLAEWADSISVGANRGGVAQPWRDGFRRLGASPLMKQLQRERARRQYFDPSQVTARALQLGGDLGAALAFDIYVQNGGVKPADRKTFDGRMAKAGDRSAPARRVLLAELVAASASARWRADVAARKQAIASGLGEVHGMRLDLSAWGIDLVDPA